MTWRVLLVAVLFLGGVIADEANARSKRIRQVPNGSAASCNTCHTSGGGSPLNPFGIEIVTNFLTATGPAGDVIWGPELAELDSDGDGGRPTARSWAIQKVLGWWAIPIPQEITTGKATTTMEKVRTTTTAMGKIIQNTTMRGDASLAGKVFNPGDPTSTPPASHDTAVEVSTWGAGQATDWCARLRRRGGSRTAPTSIYDRNQ